MAKLKRQVSSASLLRQQTACTQPPTLKTPPFNHPLSNLTPPPPRPSEPSPPPTPPPPQVRRTKEILSANTEAPFSVEELHEGRDFQSSVSRADFEELADKVGYWGGGRGDVCGSGRATDCVGRGRESGSRQVDPSHRVDRREQPTRNPRQAGFWEAAAAPLKRLLARNGLKGSDVDAVEMLGGGSRIPRLQVGLWVACACVWGRKLAWVRGAAGSGACSADSRSP
jgi:hypothetical protein